MQCQHEWHMDILVLRTKLWTLQSYIISDRFSEDLCPCLIEHTDVCLGQSVFRILIGFHPDTSNIIFLGDIFL